MALYKITTTRRGSSGHKTYLENIINQLRDKGAHIINIQSKVGTIGEPSTPINVITISYEAPREIQISQDYIDSG